MTKTQTLDYVFSDKHIRYMRGTRRAMINVAEGAVRAGKTIDNVFAFAYELENAPDKIHLATGSTIANAKLNIGDCNGFGLEGIFRGRCRWGKYKDNDCLHIETRSGYKVVIFAGGGKADSFKKIRGNSYGMWIATEINLHHDNTIKEAFNRQLAAKSRKIYWDLNPDNPGAAIYTEYIDEYAHKQASGELLGGYNYGHFTIHDNATISKESLAVTLSQYTEGTVWHRRDILGQRCAAEGLIYQQFADNPSRYKTSEGELPKLQYINIGVDFGGNKSAYTFVATGLTSDYRVIVLRSKRIPAKGVSVEQMITMFRTFAEGIEVDYGAIDYVYPDNAEQAIINSMRQQLRYSILNSVKGEIIDRIRTTDMLLSSDRFKYVESECDTLVDALSTAVWDAKNKKMQDIRLDNGTSDIDTLDAFEYSWSAFIKQIIRGGGVNVS